MAKRSGFTAAEAAEEAWDAAQVEGMARRFGQGKAFMRGYLVCLLRQEENRITNLPDDKQELTTLLCSAVEPLLVGVPD